MPTFRLNASLIPTLRSENLADVLTERFTFALKISVKMLARFSNLKVGIRELSFSVHVSKKKSTQYICIVKADNTIESSSATLKPGMSK